MKSQPTLDNFVKFCEERPELRFWQSIYAWLEADEILIDNKDPFHWEGKNRITP